MRNDYSRVKLLASVNFLNAPPCSTVMVRSEDRQAGVEGRQVPNREAATHPECKSREQGSASAAIDSSATRVQKKARLLPRA